MKKIDINKSQRERLFNLFPLIIASNPEKNQEVGKAIAFESQPLEPTLDSTPIIMSSDTETQDLTLDDITKQIIDDNELKSANDETFTPIEIPLAPEIEKQTLIDNSVNALPPIPEVNAGNTTAFEPQPVESSLNSTPVIMSSDTETKDIALDNIDDNKIVESSISNNASEPVIPVDINQTISDISEKVNNVEITRPDRNIVNNPIPVIQPDTTIIPNIEEITKQLGNMTIERPVREDNISNEIAAPNNPSEPVVSEDLNQTISDISEKVKNVEITRPDRNIVNNPIPVIQPDTTNISNVEEITKQLGDITIERPDRENNNSSEIKTPILEEKQEDLVVNGNDEFEKASIPNNQEVDEFSNNLKKLQEIRDEAQKFSESLKSSEENLDKVGKTIDKEQKARYNKYLMNLEVELGKAYAEGRNEDVIFYKELIDKFKSAQENQKVVDIKNYLNNQQEDLEFSRYKQYLNEQLNVAKACGDMATIIYYEEFLKKADETHEITEYGYRSIINPMEAENEAVESFSRSA